MKPIFILVSIFLLSYNIIFAQELIENELDSIKTESEATKFIEHHKSINGKLITFNREKHHSKIYHNIVETILN